MSAPPPVALTCGDPSGVGPELAAKAWGILKGKLTFFWIGDPRHLPSGTAVVEISEPSEASKGMSDGLPVLAQTFPKVPVPGSPSPENASGIVAAIEMAVDLALSGKASAVCTSPIAKKVLVDHAGFPYPGHTEFLAALGGAKKSVMMLASDELKVVPATIHIPLREVPNALSAELLEETIRILHSSLREDFGLEHPRIAVAGLNPHAGEGGLLGTEDDEIIRPVCENMIANGLKVVGPLPADTMFHSKARMAYDAAVAMYHDQALVPIKTLAFDRGVNVTLGLPFVRTSPDHGTAFDIAGQGVADPTSLVEALLLADQMASNRAKLS